MTEAAATGLAAAVGLTYIDDIYIADAAGGLPG
jgi:hypothetical protein